MLDFKKHKGRPMLFKKILISFVSVTSFLFALESVAHETKHHLLHKIERRAHHSKSDEVLIQKDSKIILDYKAEAQLQPLQLMSITKAIVSLAIGFLIDDGKIKSVDVPLYEFFPEWKQGLKKEITLKHILTHTSGLQDSNFKEINESPDTVQFALAADMEHIPGKKVNYNNKIFNLLPAIVKKASGKTIEDYLNEKLFCKLGIKEFFWEKDKAGQHLGYAGLYLKAKDLAAIALMMVNDGKFEQEQVLSKQWIKESLTPHHFIERSAKFSKAMGFGWWLITNNSKKHNHPVVAFFHEGWLGQKLVVIPRHKIIALRQIRLEKAEQQKDSFDDFMDLILRYSGEN
jgi:CubicO group peptidase (beta-lactamase class C family)